MTDVLLRKRNSSVFRARVTDTPILSQSGNLLGVIEVASEVSGQSLSERNVCELEDRLLQRSRECEEGPALPCNVWENRIQNEHQQQPSSITSITHARGEMADRSPKATQPADKLGDAQRDAESANCLKNQFLASMSHEIRTPINGVLGMTDLILATPLSEEQRDFAESIRSSGEALLAVIGDILDFYRIEAGEVVLEKRQFDVVSCIEDVVDVFAEKATEKGIELVNYVDSTVPPFVAGDSTRLQQVLMNMLSNAIKFTNGGDVTVSVSASPYSSNENQGNAENGSSKLYKLKVTVQDMGIGIDTNCLNSLFQPFCQLDNSMTRKFGGIGLGLIISRQLIELMGGDISAESEGLGKGSVFTFSIIVEEVERMTIDPSPLASCSRMEVTNEQQEETSGITTAVPVSKVDAVCVSKAGPLARNLYREDVRVELEREGSNQGVLVLPVKNPEIFKQGKRKSELGQHSYSVSEAKRVCTTSKSQMSGLGCNKEGQKGGEIPFAEMPCISGLSESCNDTLFIRPDKDQGLLEAGMNSGKRDLNSHNEALKQGIADRTSEVKPPSLCRMAIEKSDGNSFQGHNLNSTASIQQFGAYCNPVNENEPIISTPSVAQNGRKNRIKLLSTAEASLSPSLSLSPSRSISPSPYKGGCDGRLAIVVESHAKSRNMLAEHFRTLGMDVLVASTGEAAEELVGRLGIDKERPPGILLIDTRCGWTPVNREDLRLGPVIFLTPHGQKSLVASTHKEAAAVLSRPIKQSQLTRVLLEVLQCDLSSSVRRPKAKLGNSSAMATEYPLRILLAEDNPINQKVAVKMLARLGYKCAVASTGLEVLQALRNSTFDLILMDLQMPEMDGIEATKRILAEFPALERPQIYALTANVLESHRSHCISIGMDGFLSKPVNVNDLKHVIQLTRKRL